MQLSVVECFDILRNSVLVLMGTCSIQSPVMVICDAFV